MNIYVGNLPYQLSDDELRQLFEAHGSVVNASIIQDRETGRSKGFGFVEMQESGDAEKAIEALDGSSVDGRNIKVNQARPREERSGGGNQRKRW